MTRNQVSKFKVDEIVKAVVSLPFGVANDEPKWGKGTRLKIIGIRVGAPYPYIATVENGFGYPLYLSESEIQSLPIKDEKTK